MDRTEQEKIEDTWHNKRVESIIDQLKTSTNGLNTEEVIKRLHLYGKNQLPTPQRKSNIVRFIAQFNDILIYVLLFSSAISAFLGYLVDTTVILAVVVINAIIGFIQENKAEKSIESIRAMLAPHANVIRNGKRTSIKAEHIVPGDVVLLESGDKVPADIRLFKSHSLQIQESILTGESLPVEKSTDPVEMNASLGDRSCIAFSGTIVATGQGEGIAVKTGELSEIGRISATISSIERLTSPLIKQMNVFSFWMTLLICISGFLLIIFGYFVKHHNFNDLFMAVVGLCVAAIPEGLPAVLTITLAVGVQSMAKRNAIVRQLPAIEAIGSVSVICTDKTGTLTKNEMSVSSVITNNVTFSLDETPKVSESLINNHVLKEIALSGVLCNNAFFNENSSKMEGDPVESALLAFSKKVDVDMHQEQIKWKRINCIPFDSRNAFMATLNQDSSFNTFIFVKGSPEKILSMCNKQLAENGQEEPLDRDFWEKNSEKIAFLGQRVLAIARKKTNSSQQGLELEDMDGSLTLLGIIGMIDPPRIEVIDSIKECHNAGIQVKMITGDHSKTAAAIGKQIGIKNPEKVLTGPDLDCMDDEKLKIEALECNIFARTTPEHKLRLVKALQSHDMVVAMTGDGVNDTPALRRADIGIAMGDKGSEAAKEVSEIVLTDDNFASIVSAIREGRTVQDNIKKVISWTLPTSTGKAAVIIFALLFGTNLPMTPVQILWINLITCVTLGIALAFEKTDETTMLRRPRPRNEPIMEIGLAWHVVLVSILFTFGAYGIYYYAIDKGYSASLAQTLAVNTVVALEAFHLLFIRNIDRKSLTWNSLKGTKIVWITICIVIAAQSAITYVPFLQKYLGTSSISFHDIFLIMIISVSFFFIAEIEKHIRLSLQFSEK